jgi:hypothetical protein
VKATKGEAFRGHDRPLRPRSRAELSAARGQPGARRGREDSRGRRARTRPRRP